MIRRTIVFAPEAEGDLQQIHDRIFEKAGERTALAYIDRMSLFCGKLDLAAQRGSVRDDIRPGLRAIGFERSATVAFSVDDTSVTILRIFGRGRNWTRDMAVLGN